MNKYFAFFAIAAAVCFVSCKENKQDPEPEPAKATTATITASDVTVEEGATAKINATTNSTATITFAVADAAIATVSNDGTVTGVKAGSTTVKLAVAAVEGKFTEAEKTINVTVTAKPDVPPTPAATITIDGDFSDWPQLEAGTFVKSVCDPEAPWEGVKEIRCYATPETVFYYIKFDEESLADALVYEAKDSEGNDEAEMHIRLCINTDGEFESGYANYFLEAYDFIIEGAIADEGAFIDFDGTLHQRIGSWKALLEPENGLVTGKGNGTEYEIALDRETFNIAANTSDVPMPMGDEFQTGIRFYYNGWSEFSNMPNCSVEEEQGNGWGYLMRVKTNK